MENGLPSVPNWTLSCFTDGSKIDGNAGAAYFITEVEEEIVIPLGIYATVYQAEILVIVHLAMNLNQNDTDHFERVNIYVDSLSSLQKLQSSRSVTELELECFEALNELASSREVNLDWIPAHMGFFGNEKADELAKTAARTAFVGPQPSVPVSSQLKKTAIKKWGFEEHSQRWSVQTKFRNTKSILGEPKTLKGNFVLKLDRNSARILTQVVTGHSALNEHLHRMGLINSPLCNKCEKASESRDHFLCECEAFGVLRYIELGKPKLTQNELRDLSLNEILVFIKGSKRFQVEQTFSAQ
jgi:ribonuclease HI